jgi:hypothetical protein
MISSSCVQSWQVSKQTHTVGKIHQYQASSGISATENCVNASKRVNNLNLVNRI